MDSRRKRFGVSSPATVPLPACKREPGLCGGVRGRRRLHPPVCRLPQARHWTLYVSHWAGHSPAGTSTGRFWDRKTPAAPSLLLTAPLTICVVHSLRLSMSSPGASGKCGLSELGRPQAPAGPLTSLQPTALPQGRAPRPLGPWRLVCKSCFSCPRAPSCLCEVTSHTWSGSLSPQGQPLATVIPSQSQAGVVDPKLGGGS